MAHSSTSSEHAEDMAQEGRERAIVLARLADEKQAEDIVLLDLRGISSLTDFLVICSGSSTPHLRAIRKNLVEKASEIAGLERNAIEGNEESQWLILDYWEVMIHVFHPAKRELYALEALWGDAPVVDWRPVDC